MEVHLENNIKIGERGERKVKKKKYDLGLALVDLCSWCHVLR